MREQAPSLDSLPWRSENDLRFADMDRQGHVSNGIFDRLMESNRVALIDMVIGGPGPDHRFVLARIEIDFLGEMFWPGKVLAGGGVERIGTSSITFRQALFNKETCVAAGRSTVVYVDPKSHGPRPLSPELRTALDRWTLRSA